MGLAPFGNPIYKDLILKDIAQINEINKTVVVKQGIQVAIICRDHGKFKQQPTGYLQGKGCKKCNKNRPLDTHNFIIFWRKV
jgi:hypothetical protein